MQNTAVYAPITFEEIVMFVINNKIMTCLKGQWSKNKENKVGLCMYYCIYFYDVRAGEKLLTTISFQQVCFVRHMAHFSGGFNEKIVIKYLT